MFQTLAIFDNLGTTELVIVGIAALLLFGKRLPEVASQAGATLAKFRRSLDSAIHDSGVEQEIKKIKSALPTDLSVRDVTRAAVRKFEGRMREEIEPVIQSMDPTKSPIPAADATAPPSTEARPSPMTAPRAGVDPASQFAASGDPAAASTESGKIGLNGTASSLESGSNARNGVDPSGIATSSTESTRSNNSEGPSADPDASAVERVQQSGIPPRALPPGSVPRD